MQDKNQQKMIEITIEELIEGESINAFEFGYFLYYFRSAYVVCLEVAQIENVSVDNAEGFAKKILLSEYGQKISNLWLKNLQEEFDLEFVSISKQSPLKIVANSAGFSLVALTMAVILSGGEANPYTGEFKMPPLIHAIRALKAEFGQKQRKLPSEKKLESKRKNSKTEQEETQYLTRSSANAADLLDAVKEIAERHNLIERELIEA